MAGVRADGHLVRGSAWVMAGFVGQAVTGVVFWLLAAHTFDSDALGRGAAVFASMQFVNYATALGLQEMLGRFHHEADEGRDVLFTWSLVATGLTSAAGAGLYLATASSVRDVLGGPAGALLFFALSAGAAVALLVDVRLMAVRRWRWVFWRLVLVGAARIPMVWLPSPGDDAVWLFVVSAAPIAVSGLAGLAVVGARLRLRPLPAVARAAVRYAGVNYVSHLALLAPQFVLPVIVLLHVDPTANANFFLAWSMAAVAHVLPVTIARVLVAEGSRPGTDLGAHVARALRLALAVMAVAAAGAVLAGPLVPGLYGSSYRDAGQLLPVLVAAGLPWAVTAVALGHSRVRHDPVGTVVITAVLAAGVLGLALVRVPAAGVDGSAQAWLAGNVVAAVVAGVMWRRADTLPVGVSGEPGTRTATAAVPSWR